MANNYYIEVTPVLKRGVVQNDLNAQANEIGKSGALWGSKFSTQFRAAVGRTLAYGIINATKDMVNNVMELDKAQTELKKVTTLSGESLEKFTSQAYKAGKATARTGTEMVQASTEFAKMGIPENQLQSYATAAT